MCECVSLRERETAEALEPLEEYSALEPLEEHSALEPLKEYSALFQSGLQENLFEGHSKLGTFHLRRFITTGSF